MSSLTSSPTVSTAQLLTVRPCTRTTPDTHLSSPVTPGTGVRPKSEVPLDIQDTPFVRFPTLTLIDSCITGPFRRVS